MSTINEKIKEYRKQNGYTQAYMAKRLGISQPAYQKIEAGDTDSMRVSTLRKLCEEFNLSADWVIGIDTKEAAKLKLSAKDLDVLRARGSLKGIRLRAKK